MSVTKTPTVGEALPFLLNAYGVDTVFGMPGVHSLAFYKTLDAAGIRHVGVRHEQGAGFMADGYARACGRPGVALLISGPGVTNAATPLGQAYSDSVPVLAITAAIATGDTGLASGALHEITDQPALTRPITGLSATVASPEQAPRQLARAFARFAGARPRPVHIGFPLDVLDLPVDAAPEPIETFPKPGPDPATARLIADMLSTAEAPAILAGGGAIGASAAIRALVDQTGATFVSTVAGKGIVPEDHPLSLGSTLQRPATRLHLKCCDLVIAIGTEIAEPDLYVTADAEAAGDVPPEIAEPRLIVDGTVVRIDLDPDMLAGSPPARIGVLSDAQLAVEAILAALLTQPARDPSAQLAETRQQNKDARSKLEQAHDVVLGAIRDALPEDGLIYSDMTQIGYTGCITFPVSRPACWHFPMGFGTLGYALPAAIGGQIACPNRATIALVGDGGLQFTLQELATAKQLGLPLAIVLWNNDALGEIADFMNARGIPEVDVRPENPDFALLARSYGIGYAQPVTPNEITAAVAAALAADGPTLIEVHQAVGWHDAASNE
ncbi:MAG: 5-guanidino-2-oxopentanoate decarboxylase [Pseudomonadota bacterium]